MIIWQNIIITYVIVTNAYAMAQKLQISDAEYAKMPPLFMLDSYRSCLLEPQDFYCKFDVELDSNETSPLLNLMKEYSAHQTRFNHQKLNRGVCVSRSCAKYINISTEQLLDERNVKPILQQCINESLWHEYGLDAYVTKVDYCERYKDSNSSKTLAQWAVAGILGIILALNIFGSFYSNFLENTSDGNTFLLAFSMKKNVDRILNGSENKDNNFGSLLGLRFLSTLFVIIVHTGFLAVYYIENSKFVEDMYDSTLKSIIIHGTALIEFFFVCSSFLLSFNYFVMQSSRKFSWWFSFIGIIDRYLRLTPILILVMALISTWQPMFGSGPILSELIKAESTNCKQNWWKILLYVSNYLHFSNDVCLPHTWYLAADMQLFILGLIVIMLIYRYPKRVWLIFSTIIIIGVSIPAVITFKNGLLPVFLYRPEIRRESFAENKEFAYLYVTAYGHICSAAIGLIAGWLQYHIQKNKVELKQWKIFNWAFTLGIPGCVLLVQSDIYFIRDSNGYGPIFAMFYAGAIRLAYSLFIAIIILGAINKCGKRMSEFLEWTPLQCLGRMSYCAYILHMPVLKQYFSTQTAPIVVAEFNVIVSALGCAAMTYILSFALCVMVEYPVNELRRLLFKVHIKQIKKE